MSIAKSSGRVNVNTTLINMQETSVVTPEPTVQTIALPLVPNGSSEPKWKEVKLTNRPVQFTTKERITMELQKNKQQQLEVTITSAPKSSHLTLEIAEPSLKIDNEGNAIISFQDKEVELTIESSGKIRANLSNLDEPTLPKEALPLGTTVKMTNKEMQFTLPLTKTITF